MSRCRSARHDRARTFAVLVIAGCANVRSDGDAVPTSVATDPGEGDETSHKLDLAIAPDAGGTDDPCGDAAALESSQGCEFWAVDLPNSWGGVAGLGNVAPNEQQFAVIVANGGNDRPANVTIHLGSSAETIDQATVPVGEVHTFELDPGGLETRANTYDSPALRIVSDVPITAYQFNPLDNSGFPYSNDASVLLPTAALGTDYIAVTGDAILLATETTPEGDNAGAFITIVAVEDGTIVDVWPTATLYPGAYDDLVLDRGRSVTLMSERDPDAPDVGNGNLSGSRIRASAPVAVFSGNVSTIEPNPGACCADHLEDQLLPATSLGVRHVVAAPQGQFGPAIAACRIVGAHDGTVLHYAPEPPDGAPTTIDAFQTVRFQTHLPFAVWSDNEDKPFVLAQFLLSRDNLLFGAKNGGDPALIMVPPLEQFQPRFAFVVPTAYQLNFITVIRPQGVEVLLDDAAIPAERFIALATMDGVAYESAHVSVTVGAHRLDADEPVAVVSVGYAEAVSYGYPAGSSLRYITPPPPIP